MQRPTGLTIIGWLLIVLAGFGLISQLTMQDSEIAQQVLAESPLPAWLHTGLGIVGSLVTVLCGYGVLKGLNWSRFVYVGWSVFGLIFGLLTMPFTSIIVLEVLFFAVFTFCLFRPSANPWFTGQAANARD